MTQWQKPWRKLMVHVPGTCLAHHSLGQDLTSTGSCLAGTATAPAAAATHLACPGSRAVHQTSGVSSYGSAAHRVLTHPGCLQPCWWRSSLCLPMQHCTITALLPPSLFLVNSSKAGGNAGSSPRLQSLLQGPSFSGL